MGNNTLLETKYKIEVLGFCMDLVATDKIIQGETILFIPTQTQPNPDRYSLEVYPGIHINCSIHPIGAINHSCEPNSAVRNGKIVAWSCIEPEESITINYKNTEQKLVEPFDCNCGSISCQGRIE